MRRCLVPERPSSSQFPFGKFSPEWLWFLKMISIWSSSQHTPSAAASAGWEWWPSWEYLTVEAESCAVIWPSLKKNKMNNYFCSAWHVARVRQLKRWCPLAFCQGTVKRLTSQPLLAKSTISWYIIDNSKIQLIQQRTGLPQYLVSRSPIRLPLIFKLEYKKQNMKYTSHLEYRR